MLRFQKHYVTDGKIKARVRYCAGYFNDTDGQTDYFEKGLVRLDAGSEHYVAAMQRAQAIN